MANDTSVVSARIPLDTRKNMQKAANELSVKEGRIITLGEMLTIKIEEIWGTKKSILERL